MIIMKGLLGHRETSPAVTDMLYYKNQLLLQEYAGNEQIPGNHPATWME